MNQENLNTESTILDLIWWNMKVMILIYELIQILLLSKFFFFVI